ncbi:RING finger protein 151-like isoform X2 [Oscarella lobularis]|uniref:RING finger protein 151-like isoform X2 n=1 Tax=Oscarella lobularis TaxID=121494 RepID=UPI0033132774
MAEADALESRFQCDVCHCTLKDPAVTPCRHIFCKVCIERWLDNGRRTTCPTCRSRLRKRDLHKPSCLVNEMLLTVQTRCERFELGCTHTFSPDATDREKKHHETQCNFVGISCKKCHNKVLRKYHQEHIQKWCAFAMIDCPGGCGRRIERRQYKGNCATDHVLGDVQRKFQGSIDAIRSDIGDLKSRMEILFDDVACVKMETTSSLTTILRWAMPRMEVLERSFELSTVQQPLRNSELTFSRTNRRWLNPVHR